MQISALTVSLAAIAASAALFAALYLGSKAPEKVADHWPCTAEIEASGSAAILAMRCEDGARIVVDKVGGREAIGKIVILDTTINELTETYSVDYSWTKFNRNDWSAGTKSATFTPEGTRIEAAVQ